MDTEGSCTGCAVSDAIRRREFVGEVIGAALLAMGASAFFARAAAAMPPQEVSGAGSRSAKLYPIPAADGVSIDKSESVIIARYQGRAYAFSLACPHQNTALRWDAKRTRFQCPKHNSRYQPTGVFIEGRATRSMDRFAVKLDGDRLLVDLDTLYRQDKEESGWNTAFVQLAEGEK